MTHLNLPFYMKRIRSSDDFDSKDNIVGYALCDMTGDTIIPQTTLEVCRNIMNIVNTHHSKSLKMKEEYGELALSLRVPIEPMEKPATQIVAVDEDGTPCVATSPAYIRYIKQFCDALKKTGQVLPEQPIDYKCQVIVRVYSSNMTGKSIFAYAESVLDCLVSARVLSSKGHRVVNNIDGSRIYGDESKPRIEIFVRKWVARKNENSRSKRHS